jgi:hypothetical protein
VFFFEKKNQKTFILYSKSFLLLFFKKVVLSEAFSPAMQVQAPAADTPQNALAPIPAAPAVHARIPAQHTDNGCETSSPTADQSGSAHPPAK